MNVMYSPVYLLRGYAWEVLKRNTSMKESDYDGMIPIVPLAEEPEILTFGKPYMVYGYALNSSDSLYARKSGSMTFAIYNPNFRELTKILAVLTTAFERQDDAARDVNRWSSTIPQFVGINFGYINIGFVEGGTPEDTEGGAQSALINIRFEYYVDYDVVTNVV